ncbi:enamelin isoform X1 [Peromyscus californicus insignis]|uniref:enamelin isoform X1 n=1 Tax=Peromyscus californicus insignis TaxID=564181 RepID=UPI0022A73D39|nr:enamelin isoform X1 [Peromyscus californicus insignis]
MLLLQCRNPASLPRPCNLVPNVKMEILLVLLGLLSNSAAMPFQMPMPRMPGFSSKSEEMMRYSQFNFMNAPPMMHMGPYGNGLPMPPHMPPPYPPYQMPMWPQPVPNAWNPPPMPNFPSKTDQTQETAKPNQTNPQEPQPQKQPPKEPPNEAARAKEEAQPPQPFPPFGNGLYPYQQPPWPIPQRGPPPAFGRPKFSNEEGNPYYAYFGYHGFGGRPYYSEEMFEDYEKPKEKDPPKPEDPPPDDPPPEASTNSTVPEANATQSVPGGSQGGNDTSPIGNRGPGPNAGNNPTVQNGIFPLPKVNVSGQGVSKNQIPWRPSQPNIYENYPYPNMRNYPSGRQWQTTGTMEPRQNRPGYQNPQIQRGPQWNSFDWEGKQTTRPGNPTYRKPLPPTSGVNYANSAGNPVNFGRKLPGPNKPFLGANPASNKPFLGTNPASNKPFLGANPASNKPFVGTNPASNKPFLGANPASNKPFVGTNPVPNKPFVGANPAANKPFVGTNPAANKPSTGANAAANKPFVRNNAASNKPFVGTNAATNKPLVRNNAASNKPFVGANAASNKHPVGTNVASMGPKQVTDSHNVKTQNPKEKSLGQKERTVSSTKDTARPWRNSQQYGINTPNYNLPHPEGSRVGPNFNSFDQQENSYFSRGDSRRMPSPKIQIQSQNLPKGIALEPRRTPFESETKKPELKHSTQQPAYPKKIPSPTRRHFPAERNSWNHQEIPPPLKEDHGRQEEMLPYPSYGSRGNIFYHDYNNPYYPNENSPYIRSNTWNERVSSPSTMRQPENPQYPMNSLDQKETEQYNEEDPIDPNEDESFPGQSKWGDEELNFKGSPTIRHYEGEKYASTLPQEYLPYSLGKPPKETFPYSEIYPWNPHENFPIYNPGPTIAPPVDPRNYYINNAIGQEESTLFPSWTPWDHGNQAQKQRESEPYFSGNVWGQSTSFHKSNPPNQKRNHPYSTSSPAGLPKDPTWLEGENSNYDLQITNLNPPEREQLAFPDFIPQSYPSGQNEAHLFHQSQRGSCCIGGSTAHKDNVLALQDYTSSYGLAPREIKKPSPVHTESSYTKYARPHVSPTSILPSQRNISENKLTAESPNPSPFGDGVPALRRNTPYSGKNQLDTGIMALPEASSPQPKNTPCLKSDLGGDRRDILKQFFEGSQLSERTADLIPEQLVIDIPDKGSGPDSIQSEGQGNGDEMQQQRPPTILKVPCFSSKLAKFHSSSTGPPTNDGRQSLLNGALSTPTENPKTSVGLATREQFKSINVDQANADEHTTFEAFQGTSQEDQVQGCLLLQA